MNPTVYNTALVVHIAGITLMAGTTFIDFIVFRLFRKIFPQDKSKGLALADIFYRLQRFMGIGMLVILLSGVMMMVYLHQVWGQQVWFRVKMAMLLLIIINGLAIRRRLGNKLKNNLTGDKTEPGLKAKLAGLESSITSVQVLQLAFFLIIFVLSVFKFN
jgi:hypothetical protein